MCARYRIIPLLTKEGLGEVKDGEPLPQGMVLGRLGLQLSKRGMIFE